MEFPRSSSNKVYESTIFISHKHSDLERYGDDEEVKGFINYLVERYRILPYIDCFDPNMPPQTCGETANRIKNVIEYCDRFILFGTAEALESRWCNWEVGIADKTKSSRHEMAILPLLNQGQKENTYEGNEYLQLYPVIVNESILDEIKLFVVFPDSGHKITLQQWLEKPNSVPQGDK